MQPLTEIYALQIVYLAEIPHLGEGKSISKRISGQFQLLLMRETFQTHAVTVNE